MNKLFKAQFRRGKVGFTIVIVFIILAVFLMTIGLSIVFQYDKLYDKKMEEINSAHATLYLGTGKISEALLQPFVDKIKALEYVEDSFNYEYLEFEKDSNIVWSDGNEWNYTNFVDESLENPYEGRIKEKVSGVGIPIYLSSFFNIKNKRQLGEQLKFKYLDQEYDMYIGGFYESLTNLYSSTMYTDHESYEFLKGLKVIDPMAEMVVSMMDVRFTTYNYANLNSLWKDVERVRGEVLDDFILANNVPPEFAEQIIFYTGIADIDLSISSAKPYILLMSVLMIVFALLITLIALLIIRFLIKSAIEEDMRNIGILKAVGLTTMQLRMCYLKVYSILLAIGAVLGIVIAYFTTPVFGNIIQILSNMYMTISFSGVGAVIAFISIIAMSLSFIYFTTRRLRAITPISAIRSRTTGKAVKKNYAPLEKSHVPINVALGVKSIFNNKRQSSMIFVILMIMTIVCSFASIVYYNMNVNQTVMVELSGEETFDVGLWIDNTVKENNEKVAMAIAEVEKLDGIETSAFDMLYNQKGTLNDDFACSISMAWDYSLLRTI